jgi:Tfp pilus assembly protein PilO
MTRWQWTAQRLAAAVGIPGLIGLLLLVSGISLYFTAIQTGAREVDQLKQQLAGMRSHPQTVRQYAPEEELAMFYDFFPKREALAEQLRTLHHLAVDQDLLIERIDYKLSSIQSTPLWRYQISFPLNTDYTTLRHYVADVLKALPNAALETIDMQRDDADAELLEEKIGIVLFYREAP